MFKNKRRLIGFLMLLFVLPFLIAARYEYLDITKLEVLSKLILRGATPIEFEGATNDAYETILGVTDPTADRYPLLPDHAGVNMVVSDTGTTIRYSSVDLTNAQIKDLKDTTVDLVAAPGAGYVLELVSAVLILDYGSEVLTESADNLVIQYDGGQDATAAIEMTGFIDQSADTIAVIPAATIAAVASANVANDALELFNTGDGDFGGNASNDTTMTVKIAYRIHALGL